VNLRKDHYRVQRRAEGGTSPPSVACTPLAYNLWLLRRVAVLSAAVARKRVMRTRRKTPKLLVFTVMSEPFDK
jgi:hypothetical protein